MWSTVVNGSNELKHLRSALKKKINKDEDLIGSEQASLDFFYWRRLYGLHRL